MASDMAQLEALFLALGDRTRLRLLSLMAAGPVPVGRLVDMTGESQPKVSRHLANLRNYGIVTAERVGKQVFYGIDLSGDTQATHMLAAVINSLTGTDASPTPPRRLEGSIMQPKSPEARSELSAETYVSKMLAEEELSEIETANEPGWTEPEEREMDVFLL